MTTQEKKTKFIELHIIQNFAPSCLNRDDTNAPKDCVFGGYRRARISSQCIKRSIRWHEEYQDCLGQQPSLRTKRIKDELMERLCNGKNNLPQDDVGVLLDAFIPAALTSLSGDATKVLLFLGRDEIDCMEQRIVEKWESVASIVTSVVAVEDNKKSAEKAAKSLAEACKEMVKGLQCGTKAADIAMFGRMVAGRSELREVDAACQVGHAISTHKVDMEMDYYTAVDDLPSVDNEPGAGMLGNTEFNSSCFYRYSLVDIKQLASNLSSDEDLARRAIEAFIRSSVAAIPSGKKNSFAQQNPPAFVFAVVRDEGAPWSLVNAFEKPVRVHGADEQSLSAKSCIALEDYWHKLVAAYGDRGIVFAGAFSLEDTQTNNAVKRVESLTQLVDGVMGAAVL